MSDPIRYSIVADYQAPWAKMHEFRSGDWVKWDDYARLKAEVENSKRINTELLVLSNRQASDIRRLRKAGDELANTIQFNEEMEKDYDGETIVHPSVERWNEAKEGKQS